MPSLVALDLPAGPQFVAALVDVWEAGDAALPIDPRLPEAARREWFSTLRPERVITPGGSTDLDGRPVASGDALVVPSSGTSGNLRGAVLTHDAVAAAAEATSARLEVDPSIDVWLACLPLSHMGGLGVVTRALHTGTQLEVQDGFEPERVLRAARQGATLVSLVAALLPRVDLSVFRRVLLGGGPAPPRVPSNVTVTYGLTESGGGIVYDGTPLPGAEVRIRDGEILVRGPMLLRCYRDGTDPKDAAGWLATGDLGFIDADGKLVVTGRKSDLIVSGGENVWPGPVEERLLLHPAVADVAIIGRADPEWGEIVVAVVVAEPGHAVPGLSELRAFAKAALPGFMAPRAVEYRDHLPRTSLGKVRRRAL